MAGFSSPVVHTSPVRALTTVRRPHLALLRSGTLALTCLALALIAGFFYAYACSVVLGLARLPDVPYVAAMQALNLTVRNGAFFATFFGSLLVGALALALRAAHWREPSTVLLAAALLVYGLGAFLPTATVNVPLNRWLDALGPVSDPALAAATRAAYEQPWARWNLLRAVCATLAFGLSVVAVNADRSWVWRSRTVNP